MMVLLSWDVSDFCVSAPSTSACLSWFGMTPPKEGWSGFEHMMLDYLFLHAHGAACVKQTGLRLSSVASKYAKRGAKDPLERIKDWIRKHAYTTTAKNVVRVELKNQLATCDAAAGALVKFAAETVETKEPCFVLALNGDKAPFGEALQFRKYASILGVRSLCC
ncbi:Hypothetical protein, putative [Bodo saltans]|uniref:Uncharacterized protein n=1 Tax=Bodo saltans TaxID=75058 RepID=A0A0S4INW5_BODSA|nr:Hypothetical protein, putative [Bodo saltans]|eukprot:CUE68470.1 Hypothetical protein, putative [Bodo saltans]